MFTNQQVFIDTIFRPKTKTITAVRDVLLILSFAVATAVCSQIKLEIGAVPITMQTFAVLLSGALLGSRRGALSQLTYLSMGLSGIPWFSRGGGIGYLLSPTFGYILGFVFAAFFVGWLCEKGFDRDIRTAVFAMFAGSIIIYVPGLFWLAKLIGFGKVLAVGLYPFIFGDLLKILLAGLLLPLGWKIIKRLKT